LTYLKYTPFTLEEAEEIREDFEDLVDTDFKIGASPEMFVENVVIAPFPSADRETFIARYFATRNGSEALAQYGGVDYDVVLVTCETSNDTNYSDIGIREFAELRGIKYEFPVRD
jgi:hypothetical protein